MAKEKSTRGNSSQFFVAGELCRRGYSAVVTLGNCPNTDILVSNIEGTKFAHIQVKTFVPGNRTCSVGLKAEKYYGPKFFWVIAGIPTPEQKSEFEYFIIPSKIMATQVMEGHQLWLKTPGRNGQAHNDSNVRTVHIPPHKSINGWDIRRFKNRWDLIDKKLRA
jgi:hypothetical protein